MAHKLYRKQGTHRHTPQGTQVSQKGFDQAPAFEVWTCMLPIEMESQVKALWEDFMVKPTALKCDCPLGSSRKLLKLIMLA